MNHSKKILFSLLVLALIPTLYNACGPTGFKVYSTTTVGNPMAPPALEQVQKTSVVDNSAQVSMGNFSNNVLSGDFIICAIFYNSATNTVAGVSDPDGDGYQRMTGPTVGAGGNLVGWTLETWRSSNSVVGGSNVNVTASFTGAFSGEKDIICNEYSGIATTNLGDGTRAQAGFGSNGSSAPMVTTYPNDLIYGAGVFDGAGATSGPGFIERASLNNIIIEDNTVNTIGSYSANFSNSPMNWIIHFSAIKGSAP